MNEDRFSKQAGNWVVTPKKSVNEFTKSHYKSAFKVSATAEPVKQVSRKSIVLRKDDICLSQGSIERAKTASMTSVKKTRLTEFHSVNSKRIASDCESSSCDSNEEVSAFERPIIERRKTQVYPKNEALCEQGTTPVRTKTFVAEPSLVTRIINTQKSQTDLKKDPSSIKNKLVAKVSVISRDAIKFTKQTEE